MKKSFLFLSLIAFVLYSCGNQEDNTTSSVDDGTNDSKLGLVDVNVHDAEADVLGEMPQYSDKAPGTSEKMDRAFENAPPMIPHSTQGLIPIKKDMNMCTTCHMPEVAVAMKATPIPGSHLTKYRPEVKLTKGDISIEKSKEVTQKDLGGKLDMARYNCTQCHVSQAKIDVAIQNTFETVFRENDLKNKSNLKSNITEGVK